MLARAQELARTADAQIGVRDREAVRRGEHRRQPRFAALSRAARHQHAQSRLRAAADAAAQLVQLREAEALRILDDHQRRVRDVDAHFDDGGGDQHLGLAGLETRHRGLAFGGFQAAVQQIDARSGQRRGDPLRRLARRAQVDLLRLLDQRVDDVGLLAARDRLLEQAQHLAPLPRAREQRAHRQAPGR
ncbi:MAG: hypothetical protein E6J87_21095 [Deltaproteobacteria bacterium]|nr:MAG: hypothetical protein E6J87_21095 [Deltaproteobacteria bacterium]